MAGVSAARAGYGQLGLWAGAEARDVRDECGQRRRRVLVHLLVDREEALLPASRCIWVPADARAAVAVAGTLPVARSKRGKVRHEPRDGRPLCPGTLGARLGPAAADHLRAREREGGPALRRRPAPIATDRRGDAGHERCAVSETSVRCGCVVPLVIAGKST